MPKGPGGERRPADVIGAAIAVGRISLGDNGERLSPPSGRVRSGYAGAQARADTLSAEKRREIAKKAARARWEE